MSRPRRILLVRHGETEGESCIRFHGATDVGLSTEGLEQMGRAAREVRCERIDLVAASPLRLSWRGAWVVGGGTPVLLRLGSHRNEARRSVDAQPFAAVGRGKQVLSILGWGCESSKSIRTTAPLGRWMSTAPGSGAK